MHEAKGAVRGKQMDKCALCGADSKAASLPNRHNFELYRCDNCGTFVLDQRLSTHLDGMDVEKKLRVSASIRERYLQFGRSVCVVPSEYAHVVIDGYDTLTLAAAEASFPRTVGERLDRALLNLSRTSRALGQSLTITGSDLFALDDIEFGYVLQSLREVGWLDLANRVTPKGWERVALLQSSAARSPTNPAFVAMWFGSDGKEETPAFMAALFDNATRPSIEKAGYRAERVDLVEHNDFIMDKVLGMIRVAPFVVADFTGNRGGVYLEAGFARGLGIPVIHTCRKSHFKDAHFDIRQINTITWEEPADLGEKLYHRIMGTLGPGPYRKDPAGP